MWRRCSEEEGDEERRRYLHSKVKKSRLQPKKCLNGSDGSGDDSDMETLDDNVSAEVEVDIHISNSINETLDMDLLNKQVETQFADQDLELGTDMSHQVSLQGNEQAVNIQLDKGLNIGNNVARSLGDADGVLVGAVLVDDLTGVLANVGEDDGPGVEVDLGIDDDAGFGIDFGGDLGDDDVGIGGEEALGDEVELGVDVGADVDLEFCDGLDDHFGVDLDQRVDDRVDVDGDETATGQRGGGGSISSAGSGFNGRAGEGGGGERLGVSSAGACQATKGDDVSKTPEEIATGQSSGGGSGFNGRVGEGGGGEGLGISSVGACQSTEGDDVSKTSEEIPKTIG